MGHATAQADRVQSAGDYEKYLLPILERAGHRPLEAGDLSGVAQRIATGIVLNRELDGLRSELGDCAMGALFAGMLPVPEAVDFAIQIQLDPIQQDRVARFGGLFVGAETMLQKMLAEADPVLNYLPEVGVTNG